jgi:hypothetical protein
VALLRLLLWLKARLVARAWQSRQGTTAALIGLFAALLGISLLSSAVFFATLEAGPELGRTVVGGVLGMTYLGWIMGPAFGYRFNEGIDPMVLAHLPVPTHTIMLGLFLGSFLDPVVLIALPLAVACASAGVMLGGSPLAAFLGLFLFLFHAMGTAQVVHLWSLAFLRGRRSKEILFVVLSLLLLAGVVSFEVGALRPGDAGQPRSMIELAADWQWIDRAVTWTPPGLAMEALMPSSPHNGVFGAPLACLVLLAIAALSVVIAARYTLMVLSGGGSRGEARRAVEGPEPDRLCDFFRLLSGSQGLAGRAAAEVRLVLREPQYLLLYISYPVAYGGACFWVAHAEELSAASRVPVVSVLVLSSIFLFTGVVFNSLAVERSGLRLAYVGPQDPLVYLVGKNLGSWFLLTSANLLVLVVAGATLGLGLGPLAGLAVSGQISIALVVGLGNLGSTLAPMPLPVQGSSTRQAATFGRIFVTMTVNALGMTVAGNGAWLGWALVVGPPMALGGPKLVVGLLALGLAWTAGLYALATWMGAWLLTRRREKLLEVFT